MWMKLLVASTLIGASFFTHGTSIAAERFHPIQQMCITYQASGQLMKGNSTRCHRKYGLEWFEIENFEIGIAGIVQKQQSHKIAIGDQLYVIDRARKTGTVSINPMYQSMQQAIQNNGSSAEEIGRSFISAMGFQPTGQTKTIAGYQCAVYASQAAGTTCLTDDALMLEQIVLGNSQIATQVILGQDGGEENYTLWQKVSMRQGVDLSNGINLQELIKQRANKPSGSVQGGSAPQIPEGLKDILKQLQPQ